MGIVVPKGAAMALHLSAEFREGQLAGVQSVLHPERAPKNPYDFFNAYNAHYAWDIGLQAAMRRLRDMNLSPGELQAAREKGADLVLQTLFPEPNQDEAE